MAITAWSAKVLSSAICLSGKWPGSGRADDDRADRVLLAYQRNGQDAPEAARRASSADRILAILEHVRDHDDGPRQDRPADRSIAAGWPRKDLT